MKYFIKRLFDIIVSLVVLVLFSPLLLIVYTVSRFKLGKPVLFKQERPGKNGKIFKMYKFRSMTDEKDSNGNLLADEIRLTRYGLFLRKTSIDELPELLNILKGDMSLVGPRPLLTQYLGRYSKEQARRHEVRPGLTGWAQINGRNAISWKEKFKLDIWYVDNWTLWLDLKILCATVLKVIGRKDINAEGAATMSEFMGNEED